MDNNLIEKYKLHFIDGKRYYEFDMTSKLPLLEDTVPYRFEYKEINIYSSSWNKMTLEILKAIDNLSPKSEEELLNIHYFWTKTEVFSREHKTNFTAFKNLFLNTNHTSTHAMMNIQGLLQAYNIPLDECNCLIKRHFSAEPAEIKDVIRQETSDAFYQYLLLNGNSDARAKILLSNFEKINKILSKVSPGYNDFFLFDDYYYFCNYKQKVLEFLTKRKYSDQDKIYRVIKKCLNHLDDFYRNRDFYEHIIKNPVTSTLIETIGNEIDNLFKLLNSDVIVSNKLYARMKMLNSSLLDDLGPLNNVRDLYKLAKLYYQHKYYFEAPFISKNINSNLSNNQIIYSYAYSLNEISISGLSQYVEKMHLKKLDNYLLFIDDSASDYVQVEEDKMIRKESLGIPTDLLERIKKELSFYLESYGSIDSETYVGYSTLPSLGVGWNKYLLLGLCRSFFNDIITIKYEGKQYKNLSYKLLLK